MFNNSTYTFQPKETVPIIDSHENAQNQPELYALSQTTLSIRPMGTIPEQRCPASSFAETECSIRQRLGIRVGGGLVNHLKPSQRNLLTFQKCTVATGEVLSEAIYNQ
jgi:hypothetical protein